MHPKKITKYYDRKGAESKFAYHLGMKLTKPQQDEIHQVMKEFETILATSFEHIKGSNLQHEHAIETGDHKPIKISPYPMTAHKKEWVEREVDEMLKSGIVS